MDAASDEIAGLLPAYALGALDAADALVVERALDRDPRYAELLAQHLESAAALAGAHAPAIPGARVRDRIMAHARGMAGEPPQRTAPRVPFPLLGAAAALAIAVVGLGAFSTVQQQRVAQLEDEVEVASAEAQGARSELAGLSDMVVEGAPVAHLLPAQGELASADAQEPLAGGPGIQFDQGALPPHHARRMRGVLITRTDGQSMLVVRGLRALEQGYIYRAWWWDGGSQTKSAAVFTVGDDGYAWVPLPDGAEGMTRFGVSVEQEMGAAEPGPQLVLHGDVYGSGK